MVLGAILSAVFGAIIGYVVGWLIELFPGFNSALTGGIQMLTGIDVSGQTKILLTGLGFLLGLLAGVVRMFAKKK